MGAMKGIAAKALRIFSAFWIAGGLLFGKGSGSAAFEPRPAETPQLGQTRTRAQQLEADLASAREQIEKSPKSMEPYKLAGMILDLMGRYPEARTNFSRIIEMSKFGGPKAAALRTMALSYAFAGDCKGAEVQGSRAFTMLSGEEMAYEAAETATELGRICLESGDIDTAYKWYRRGYDAGLSQPGITAERTDLWEFRWEHAQARIAVRRGKVAEAQKHVTQAKRILRKGTNPTQAEYLPYLTGYVAFYSGDYQTALSELNKANQDDVFIECLMGQIQEKLGNQEQAAEYYRKVSGTLTHTLPSALALHYLQNRRIDGPPTLR
jgi:tetratricopeptide (TPR) repeat protein